ncbi:MAG: hypothetical protein U0W40_06045 [Acidimicrobiia bacterium]
MSAPHLPRFALRSAEASRRLDIFLVCAVGSVLGNRVFLIITGYPQLGNGTLHISHAIWGALMMAVAIVFALSFLAPNNRTFIAFIGGCGFGWFIDELGKFITRDVNYFFKPTIALIYITFITMYLVFRAIGRRDMSADEAVLNGLEALKAASLGQLIEARRNAAVALLDETGASSPLARNVRVLLADVPNLPDPDPGFWSRWGSTVRERYRVVSERRGFMTTVTWLFGLIGVVNLLSPLALALSDERVHGFGEWSYTISGAVAGLLIVIGLPFLRRDRLRAYRWFERGILVQIFVTQVFEFADQELAGVTGLVINIALWLALRSMIRAEAEREELRVQPEPALP